jgi:hypothetical protein
MEANILEGVYIRVAGKAGETQGLAWHIVESMFGHLQSLIASLAKYELDTDGSPNLKEFEIEIFDFKPGSAVPAFRLIPKSQKELIPLLEKQKVVVANKFDELMSYANKDGYEKFFQKEHLPEVRYEIAEDLYGFIHSADNSPLSIVEPVVTKEGKLSYRQIYNVPRFSKEQSEYLLAPKKRRKSAEEPEEIYGLIQRVGKRRKIISVFENKDTVLSVSLPQIVLPDKTYYLHSPLICTVEQEDGHYIVQNEMLDLYAAGNSIDEAEYDLCIEFNDTYEHLKSLPDKDLSERLLRAKTMLNSYIKEIKNE